VVESRNQQIEVLGTQFNLNSYADEPAVRTTLVEGAVSINGTTRLSPGQQARVEKSGVTVAYVRPETFTDWKNGIFNFENEDLQSVMRKIARWYNVEVDYSSKPNSRKTYSGTISKYAKISAVLKLVEESEGIRFKVEGRKVTVIN
jgi:ferric-dicitrate binding protein FerR (iron transport regulator)